MGKEMWAQDEISTHKLVTDNLAASESTVVTIKKTLPLRCVFPIAPSRTALGVNMHAYKILSSERWTPEVCLNLTTSADATNYQDSR